MTHIKSRLFHQVLPPASFINIRNLFCSIFVICLMLNCVLRMRYAFKNSLTLIAFLFFFSSSLRLFQLLGSVFTFLFKQSQHTQQTYLHKIINNRQVCRTKWNIVYMAIVRCLYGLFFMQVFLMRFKKRLNECTLVWYGFEYDTIINKLQLTDSN